MSHCKACDVPLNKTRKWKVFGKNYEGVVPDEDEELCSTCLASAKASYVMSFRPPEVQESVISREFHYGWQDDPLSSLKEGCEFVSIQIEDVT